MKTANRTKERILLSSETAGAMPLEASSIVAVIVRCMLHLETHAKKAYGMVTAWKSEDVHRPIDMRKSPALRLGGGNCVRAESGVAEHLLGQSAGAWHAATAPVISRACAAGTLGARGHACDWGRLPMIRADLAAKTFTLQHSPCAHCCDTPRTLLIAYDRQQTSLASRAIEL